MTYWQRKLRGLCTRPACSLPAADDHCLCPEHRDGHRERNRQAMRRARDGIQQGLR